MVKRLPRRALTHLLVALACFGVAACAVYSIRATANAGADIAARKVGARGPLPGGAAAGSSGPDGPTGAAAPSNGLIVPDLFVLAPRPLSRSQRDAVAAQVGPRGHVLFTDAGAVHIGAGTTLALGVEPRAFRVYTPANTASVAPLWRSIEAGELAVAHEFAKSQHLRLGGTVVVGPGVPAAGAGRALRIGAYATTGLPGVGAVVARSRSGPIGLIPGAGALVDFPPGAEAAVGEALHRAVPAALLVSLTRPASPAASTPGRPASGPARGTHPWVLPAQVRSPRHTGPAQASSIPASTSPPPSAHPSSPRRTVS